MLQQSALREKAPAWRWVVDSEERLNYYWAIGEGLPFPLRPRCRFPSLGDEFVSTRSAVFSELPPEKLRRICDPSSLGFITTSELKPVPAIIGQARALKALQFGLGMKESGFNIYVAGIPGTGRTTAVRSFLEETAKDKKVPPDWCYVNNFRDSYRPKALRLPAGRGKELQSDVKNLVEEARESIPRAFESEQYTAKREEIGDEFNKKRERMFSELGEKVHTEGFAVQATPMGLIIIAIKPDGTPLSDQEFRVLSPEARQELIGKRERLEIDLRALSKQIRQMEHEVNERLKNLDREVALASVGPPTGDLIEKYKDHPEVVAYLTEVQNDMVDNIAQFRPEAEAQATPIPIPWLKELAFRKYQVNVIVDNSELKGAPVVIEFNPTYNNLFGRIEKESQLGAFFTDFTLIRGGAIHSANGGYLVMHADDLLTNLFSWDGLKRALGDRKIVIEEAGERLGFIVTKSLMPDPIPLDAKVVVVGNPYLYSMLYAYDEDFRELFKVKADFDTRMDWSPDGMKSYLGSLCLICGKEGLKHFDVHATAKIIEYSSRLAEDQEKLSTKFSEIATLMREASYHASVGNADIVTSSHVQKAIEEKVYRSNLIQERIEEMIDNGTILIDTTGAEVGQVNGLSVTGSGDFTFGIPSRVTVSVGLGREGIIDIEREVKLGGPIHSKGVMILSGYLADKYARNKPLTLSARLVFEQSYSEVEGDSASSTELYAILSALSGYPVRQGLAVTGSVNQRGEVQAIGGVNEKIEGFFSVCKARGLTGDQGVVIPAANARNLMLKEEVVAAVREGKFHVYPVKTIDEGIEILTGVGAGERREDGAYEEDSLNGRVDLCLLENARVLRDFLKEEEKMPTPSPDGHAKEPVKVEDPPPDEE
ncbi:MAG: AAA family ATPase [Chloroflexi bacterium]|nr:AAA family ATPase [Chloroflexota bacterium]